MMRGLLVKPGNVRNRYVEICLTIAGCLAVIVIIDGDVDGYHVGIALLPVLHQKYSFICILIPAFVNIIWCTASRQAI